jgi:tRNA G18 (ribose-2'-O)-methylase SpoU
MQLIQSLDDPRLAPYRDLKERELARQGGLFIAESEMVVKRLLASDYPVQSVLLAQRRAEEISPLVPSHVPVYVVPDAMMKDVVGFKFHSGVIAAGRRKPSPSLQQIFTESRHSERSEESGRSNTQTLHFVQGDGEGAQGDVNRATLVICPEISNTENMGSIIRIASAFGASALLLGEKSCDPFYRQSIRISMGTIFHLPIVRSDNLLRDLVELKEKQGVQLMATVLADDAESLAGASRPDRIGLLLGNEAQGLDEQWIKICDRKITIPMKLGTDSLNVAVAAALFLYHFTKE